MSSKTSTRPAPSDATGFQAWHLYLLMGMAGATWAVIEARDTHPASLLVLSAAVIAAGLIGIAVHYTALAFMGETSLDREPLDDGTREALEQEKALILRSIKELEFDRSMRKVGDADYAELDGRLRARAISLMEQLEAADAKAAARASVRPAAPAATDDSCPSCQVRNDHDARFCKSCGQKLR